ncbi:serine acetyltransferase [Salmonella enterica subsp. enterica serovar Portland]|nr:serine acetyltransferase [Salmonella enterica subsp. enterica serovar Portland]
MYIYGSKKQKKTGLWINRKLNSKFGIDIELGAVIGYGLDIPHHMGIVITKKARIGCNLSLKQNTTIGNKQGLKEDDFIIIGNNVDIGANTCIIGSITIGDNVTIGAMSFVNKSIPANSIYITKKTSEVTPLINRKNGINLNLKIKIFHRLFSSGYNIKINYFPCE